MDMEALCAAVQEASWYLKQFTHSAYPGAFRAYTERFGPAYLAAVRETEREGTALTALADELLDCLSRAWQKRRFWNRASVRMDEKQMVVNYLTPMLLGLEDPDCRRLAEVIRDRWAARWPRDAYRIVDAAELQKGFRYTIMGIEVSLPKKESDEVP